jgi:hypothetical protein
MSNFRPAEFILIALIRELIISSLKKTMSLVIYSKIPQIKTLK